MINNLLKALSINSTEFGLAAFTADVKEKHIVRIELNKKSFPYEMIWHSLYNILRYQKFYRK
jgi:hypothetical protein